MKNIGRTIIYIIMGILTVLCLFMAVGLGVAGTGICSGWTEATMHVESCEIGGPGSHIQTLADIGYALIVISSFMAGIPVLFFAGLSILCFLYRRWIHRKTKRHKKTAMSSMGMLSSGIAIAVFLIIITIALYMTLIS